MCLWQKHVRERNLDLFMFLRHKEFCISILWDLFFLLFLKLILFAINTLFSKYRSGEEYTYHTDHFIQIVMKLETVYGSYTDDLLSNFTLVRSAVYIGIVWNGIIFIYV